MQLDVKTKCKDANPKINVLPQVTAILDKDDKDNDENDEDMFRECILGDYVWRHCGWKNLNQRNMRDHIKNCHLDPQTGIYVCQICQEDLGSDIRLKNHNARVHKKD